MASKAVPDYPHLQFQKHWALMLDFPVSRPVTLKELAGISPRVAKDYATKTSQTLANDVRVLMNMDLIRKEGEAYTARTDVLRLQMPARLREDRDLS